MRYTARASAAALAGAIVAPVYAAPVDVVVDSRFVRAETSATEADVEEASLLDPFDATASVLDADNTLAALQTSYIEDRGDAFVIGTSGTVQLTSTDVLSPPDLDFDGDAVSNTRVVFDLSEASAFNIEADGDFDPDAADDLATSLAASVRLVDEDDIEVFNLRDELNQGFVTSGELDPGRYEFVARVALDSPYGLADSAAFNALFSITPLDLPGDGDGEGEAPGDGPVVIPTPAAALLGGACLAGAAFRRRQS